MRQKSGPEKDAAEQVVKEIWRATRRQFSAEEKIHIVLDGLRGEDKRSCAAARGSSRTSITVGRKSFSRPAKSAWPATRRRRRPRMRSRICAGRPAR
jgi:hypothetical protein